jgi:hypothetical protein
MAQLSLSGHSIAIAVVAIGFIPWLIALAGERGASRARTQAAALVSGRLVAKFAVPACPALLELGWCRLGWGKTQSSDAVIAGTGAMHSECAKILTGDACGKRMQIHWWGVWLQFFANVAFVALVRAPCLRSHARSAPTGWQIAVCRSQPCLLCRRRPAHGCGSPPSPPPPPPAPLQGLMRKLQAHRLTFLALFTYMLSLSTTSATVFTADAAPGFKSQQDAAAAGFVMLSFLNFAMLLLLGSFMNGDAADTPTAEVTFKTAPPPGAAAPHAVHVPPV